MYKSHSWAILPASQCLFGKNKVTLREIAKEWKSGTVVVCSKPNGQLHFIAGSSGNYVTQLADMQDVHHDQNPGNRMGGPWRILNQVQYDTATDGSIQCTWMNPDREISQDFKACMAVFK